MIIYGLWRKCWGRIFGIPPHVFCQDVGDLRFCGEDGEYGRRKVVECVEGGRNTKRWRVRVRVRVRGRFRLL
jgi:hypothetical protein